MTALPSTTSAWNWAPVALLVAMTIAPSSKDPPRVSLTVTVMVLSVGLISSPTLSPEKIVTDPVPRDVPSSP